MRSQNNTSNYELEELKAGIKGAIQGIKEFHQFLDSNKSNTDPENSIIINSINDKVNELMPVALLDNYLNKMKTIDETLTGFQFGQVVSKSFSNFNSEMAVLHQTFKSELEAKLEVNPIIFELNSELARVADTLRVTSESILDDYKAFTESKIDVSDAEIILSGVNNTLINEIIDKLKKTNTDPKYKNQVAIITDWLSQLSKSKLPIFENFNSTLQEKGEEKDPNKFINNIFQLTSQFMRDEYYKSLQVKVNEFAMTPKMLKLGKTISELVKTLKDSPHKVKLSSKEQKANSLEDQIDQLKITSKTNTRDRFWNKQATINTEPPSPSDLKNDSPSSSLKK